MNFFLTGGRIPGLTRAFWGCILHTMGPAHGHSILHNSVDRDACLHGVSDAAKDSSRALAGRHPAVCGPGLPVCVLYLVEEVQQILPVSGAQLVSSSF